MGITAGLVGAGAGLLGSSMQADASTDAAKMQSDATIRAQQMNLDAQKPWLDAGGAALTQLRGDVLGPDAKFGKSFTMADAKNSEAYKEAMRGGSDAIQTSAAAKGGLLSSNTLQDLTKFGEATGAQYENQAFNQWLQERAALLSPVQSLAGQGQTVAGQVGETNANLTLAGANAQAAGKVGAANDIAGGMQNSIQQFTMLNKLFSPGAGSTIATPSGGGTIDARYPGIDDFMNSDIRLKKNIRFVGLTDRGYKWYTWDWVKGGSGEGVIADEVAKVDPSAVRRRGGVLQVDYARV